MGKIRVPNTFVIYMYIRIITPLKNLVNWKSNDKKGMNNTEIRHTLYKTSF
jgi:hypothetical protein